MEKEKFDLQKKHTENIQELLEDTNARLSKMEAEYLAQNKSTVSIPECGNLYSSSDINECIAVLI